MSDSARLYVVSWIQFPISPDSIEVDHDIPAIPHQELSREAPRQISAFRELSKAVAKLHE